MAGTNRENSSLTSRGSVWNFHKCFDKKNICHGICRSRLSVSNFMNHRSWFVGFLPAEIPGDFQFFSRGYIYTIFTKGPDLAGSNGPAPRILNHQDNKRKVQWKQKRTLARTPTTRWWFQPSWIISIKCALISSNFRARKDNKIIETTTSNLQKDLDLKHFHGILAILRLWPFWDGYISVTSSKVGKVTSTVWDKKGHVLNKKPLLLPIILVVWQGVCSTGILVI